MPYPAHGEALQRASVLPVRCRRFSLAVAGRDWMINPLTSKFIINCPHASPTLSHTFLCYLHLRPFRTPLPTVRPTGTAFPLPFLSWRLVFDCLELRFSTRTTFLALRKVGVVCPWLEFDGVLGEPVRIHTIFRDRKFLKSSIHDTLPLWHVTKGFRVTAGFSPWQVLVLENILP